ncbi:MAG: hypothetical protein IPK10_03480 [Bacteroidetes bacterium]|nr:hypothetical protein [Bacteroidota bacterium]
MENIVANAQDHQRPVSSSKKRKMQSSPNYLQIRNIIWMVFFFLFASSFIQCKAQSGTGKYSSSNKSAVRDYEDGKKAIRLEARCESD